MTQTNQGQALQTLALAPNGYFREPIGEAKILEHYHRFFFFVNLTELRLGYNLLLDNKNLLKNRSNNDTHTFRLYKQLVTNCDEIEQLFQKFDHKSKRALANILGKAIKFVTGNLDEDDLTNINANLDKLYKNQNVELDRLNKLTTLANHLSQRYSNSIRDVTRNLEFSNRYLNNIKGMEETRIMIQTEIYHSEHLINHLLMLQRSISLAWKEIPNLELFTVNDFFKILQFLIKEYGPQQLLPIDNQHLFQVLKSCKIHVFGTNNAITFLLKIPIVKPYTAKYSQIYPIPNSQGIVMVPPKKFLLEEKSIEYWTDEQCQNLTSTFVCHLQPVQDACSMANIKTCHTMRIKNNFKIVHKLRNHQILTLLKESQLITEDCHGHLTHQRIQGMNLVSSPCKITIDVTTYENTEPTYEIKPFNISETKLEFYQEAQLQLRHLKNPEDLLKEAEELERHPIHLHLITHAVHYGLTGIIILTLVTSMLILLKFRKRIGDLLCKPRTIVKLEKAQTPSDENDSMLNEVVQSP